MRIAVGTIVIGVLLSLVGCTWAPQAPPTPGARTPAVPIVPVAGEVVPAVWATLGAPTSGTVDAVVVKPGDLVKAGDLLLRFDPTDADLAVQRAQVGLEAAQAQLALLQVGARPEDVAAARSTVSETLASIADLRVSLPAATEQARLAWVQAANVLRDAQASYENIYWENRNLETTLGDTPLPDANVDAEARAQRAVENAQAAMDQARLVYEQAQQHEKTALNTAWYQLQAARDNVALVSAGARPEEVRVAQAAIDQADVAVQAAQVALERCQVRASFAGTVGAVLVREGESVSPGQALATLGDLTTLQVETTDLAEIDVVRVAAGQKATITLDALPNQVLIGHVVSIAPMPTAGADGVHYTAIIAFDKLGPAIRWGMTAFVSIEVGE
jgi:multidrug efflux pump subunit AcrA (membrane-fusion protein)